MKKTIIYLTITLFTVTIMHSQEFNAGTNAINLGVGLGGSFGTFTTSSVSPGISVSYERGIWDIGGPGVISLGGYIGVKSYRYEILGTRSKWSYTTVVVLEALRRLQLALVEDFRYAILELS